MKKLIFGFVGMLLLPVMARADLSFTASDVEVTAGSTATVEFLVADPDGIPGTLGAFTFGIDFGATGDNNLPTGLTFIGSDDFGEFDVLTVAEAPAVIAPNFNYQVDALNFTPVGTAISATPLALFSLQFDVAASVADRTVFEIDILGPGEASPNDVFAALDADSSPVGGTITAGFGTITVSNSVAVPEPNSGMILAGIACLGALRRRRTR